MAYPSKFFAIKTKIDGHNFDSKKEARRYAELKLLAQQGDISDLQLQKKFELQEGFVDTKTKKKERAINYICDFFYWDKSEECYVVEDVKGIETKEWKIKRKMFLKKFGNTYELRVVK